MCAALNDGRYVLAQHDSVIAAAIERVVRVEREEAPRRKRKMRAPKPSAPNGLTDEDALGSDGDAASQWPEPVA